MNLQPLEDRIVVRPGVAEETTASGLVIPDPAQEKPPQGEVLAVGAYRTDVGGAQDAGAVYLYKIEANGTATHLAEVIAPYGGVRDWFGR